MYIRAQLLHATIKGAEMSIDFTIETEVNCHDNDGLSACEEWKLWRSRSICAVTTKIRINAPGQTMIPLKNMAEINES